MNLNKPTTNYFISFPPLPQSVIHPVNLMPVEKNNAKMTNGFSVKLPPKDTQITGNSPTESNIFLESIGLAGPTKFASRTSPNKSGIISSPIAEKPAIKATRQNQKMSAHNDKIESALLNSSELKNTRSNFTPLFEDVYKDGISSLKDSIEVNDYYNLHIILNDRNEFYPKATDDQKLRMKILLPQIKITPATDFKILNALHQACKIWDADSETREKVLSCLIKAQQKMTNVFRVVVNEHKLLTVRLWNDILERCNELSYDTSAINSELHLLMNKYAAFSLKSESDFNALQNLCEINNIQFQILDLKIDANTPHPLLKNLGEICHFEEIAPKRRNEILSLLIFSSNSTDELILALETHQKFLTTKLLGLAFKKIELFANLEKPKSTAKTLMQSFLNDYWLRSIDSSEDFHQLKDVCRNYGYDFSHLNPFVGEAFEFLNLQKQNLSNAQWCKHLDKLTEIMTEPNITFTRVQAVKSILEFITKAQVEIDGNYAEKLLQLFDMLSSYVEKRAKHPSLSLNHLNHFLSAVVYKHRFDSKFQSSVWKL